MKKGVILLSGGLDSLVSLDMAQKLCRIVLSLTFDYGQKAFSEEKQAAKLISKHFKIKNKIIKLSFLKKLSDNALTNPKNNNFDDFNSVWIPNRNGLFLNIAASFCDKYDIDYIIFGANREEARDFSDNSVDFCKACDNFFKFSTLKHPKILAPCREFDKIQIINYAIDNNVPLKLLKSCYNSKAETGKAHCANCMSCRLLMDAIKKSKKPELIKEIF